MFLGGNQLFPGRPSKMDSRSSENSRMATAGSLSSNHMSALADDDLEMVTSTPAPPHIMPDAAGSSNSFRTPIRRCVAMPSFGGVSGLSHGSAANASRTPSSGSRINPFDSQMSVDQLHLPTVSPSVFSIVVSPSQESESNSGQFWSLDQQARLFPAKISDDSPWKQESTGLRLDPELEDKTQEAIDLYFSRHHKVTSPEEMPPPMQQRSINRSVLMQSMGNSPRLSSTNNVSVETPRRTIDEVAMASADSSIVSVDNGSFGEKPAQSTTKWTQTAMTFPPRLPDEVEALLAKFCTFNGPLSSQTARRNNISQQSSVDEGSMSTSTLRRKLFEGVVVDDDDSDNGDKAGEPAEDDDKNDVCESTAMLFWPGKVIMTPTSNRIPSPNKSLSWSLSPVSRKKSHVNTRTPIGSSTPSKK